jgi:hypothetical protein
MRDRLFSFYLRCPSCTALLLRSSVADEDHLDPTGWTDGAGHASLAARAPSVWMCPACRRAFHAHAPAHASLTIERPLGVPRPARVREAAGVELARALGRGLARTAREERRLRLRCWWQLNDGARLALVARRLDAYRWTPGPALRANLRSLRRLLDPRVPADRLTLAELERELGAFDASARLLERAPQTDPLARLLRELVGRQLAAPAPLNAA